VVKEEGVTTQHRVEVSIDPEAPSEGVQKSNKPVVEEEIQNFAPKHPPSNARRRHRFRIAGRSDPTSGRQAEDDLKTEMKVEEVAREPLSRRPPSQPARSPSGSRRRVVPRSRGGGHGPGGTRTKRNRGSSAADHLESLKQQHEENVPQNQGETLMEDPQEDFLEDDPHLANRNNVARKVETEEWQRRLGEDHEAEGVRRHQGDAGLQEQHIQGLEEERKRLEEQRRRLEEDRVEGERRRVERERWRQDRERERQQKTDYLQYSHAAGHSATARLRCEWRVSMVGVLAVVVGARLRY